jgi:hypothetical protein
MAEGIFRGFPILFDVFTILSLAVTLCLSEFDVFLIFFVVLTIYVDDELLKLV